VWRDTASYSYILQARTAIFATCHEAVGSLLALHLDLVDARNIAAKYRDHCSTAVGVGPQSTSLNVSATEACR